MTGLFAIDTQEHPVDMLARTVWTEAGKEPVRGKEAVACVVMNRLNRSGAGDGCQPGERLAEICASLGQYDSGNSLNRAEPVRELAKSPEPEFETCLRIARRAVAGTLRDCTNRATHFHADHLSPHWASGHVPSAWIGNYLFYNDIF